MATRLEYDKPAVLAGSGANVLAAAGTILAGSRVAGDAFDRWSIDASGKQTWGDGTAAGVQTLDRESVSTLRLVPRGGAGLAQFRVSQPLAGVGDFAQLSVSGDTASGVVGATSSGFTPAGLFLANLGYLTGTGAGGLLVYSGAAAPIVFATGGTGAANERLRLDHANGRATLTAWPLLLNNGTAAGATDVGGRVSFGTGAPNNANGTNGDLYFRVDGGAATTIYQRRAGAWVGIV